MRPPECGTSLVHVVSFKIPYCIVFTLAGFFFFKLSLIEQLLSCCYGTHKKKLFFIKIRNYKRAALCLFFDISKLPVLLIFLWGSLLSEIGVNKIIHDKATK